jgi:hypothetical protein
MKWIVVKKDALHQIKDCIWVECIAEIRNNETGEIREYETEELLETFSATPSVSNWTEGNYSCDCNRKLFFQRAGNEKEDAIVECSHDKFSVNLKNKKDGITYYCEYGEI